MARVTVLAATGRVGGALTVQLQAARHSVVAVGRDAGRLAALPEPVERRVADFADASALRVALADATLVACCNNAVHLPAVLAALPEQGVERLVVMGSTRVYSQVPDATADAVRRAASLLERYPNPSVLLLATLIYGAGGSVVDGLAAQMRRLPLLPLPGGGRARVQPVHIADVAASLVAALLRDEAPGTPIVVAGPAAMPYRTMVRQIAAARGLRARVLPLPPWLVRLLAGRGAAGASLARMLEDREFDIGEMRRRLGVAPRDFAP